MYFDDFIAQQTMKNNASASVRKVSVRPRDRRLLRILWNGVRQVAWGIDASSRVRHGIDVPPGHPARRRPRRVPRCPQG
jgi:hypothetical protein